MTIASPWGRGAYGLLFTNRPYRLYFASSTLGAFASAVEFVALGWLVVALHAGPAAIIAFFAVRLGAKVLLAVPAGVIADRHSRAGIYASMRVASGLAALVGVAALLSPWPLAMVLVAAGLSSATHALDLPAHRALQGDIFPKDRLEQAVSLGNGGTHVAVLCAPIVALPAATLLGPGVPLLLAAAAFFLSALPAFRIRVTRAERIAARAAHEVATAVRFVLRRPLVVVLLAAGAAPPVLDKCVQVMLPSTSGNQHSTFGVVLAAPEFGAIVIGFALAGLPWRFSPWIPAAAAAVYAGAIASASFAGVTMEPAVIALALFVGGCAKMILIASSLAGIQRLVPAEMRGRVMTI